MILRRSRKEGRPAAAPRSLRARLGIGAALLGAWTLLTAAVLHFAMSEVAERLESALASEKRMARYSMLSTRAATFLVVAAEAVQTDQPAAARAARIAPVDKGLRAAIARLQDDTEQAVLGARALGLDQQSRFATQSLGLARMEALLDTTVNGLKDETSDKDRLRAYVDSFASGFDTLLNETVNNEVLFRAEILASADTLRRNLTRAAIAISLLTLVTVAGFYFRLIRPQFARLDRLRDAARQIGQGDFSVALPDTAQDEIGGLYAATNRMAAALKVRRDEVRAEWDRLNEVIAERTKELRAANARLEEIDENRRRLFADLSHELRTPLTVIQMEAQIGQKDGSASEAAFRTISTRALRLNRRIDDLLRVARSDSGQLALEHSELSLHKLAEEVVEEVAAEFDAAGIALCVQEVPDVLVCCDPNWARQTLVSLLRNTIRHARTGGMARLVAETDDEMAGLAVIDNGPGIAPANQAVVFERFVQAGAESSSTCIVGRKTGGSLGNSKGFGVGLALARWVTEAQGGRIELVSPVPQDIALGAAPGTKIAVRLPRVKS